MLLTSAVRMTRRFLRWWVGEILGSLPPGLRGTQRALRRHAIVAVGADRIDLLRAEDGETAPLAEVEIGGLGAGEMRPTVMRVLREARCKASRAVVCLPRSRVLRRVVDLPLAALENLRDVLSFEMDRYTPFTADAVFCDFRVVETNTALQRIKVDVAVVGRQVALDALEAARALGLGRASLRVVDDDGAVGPFQFLPMGPPKGLHWVWRAGAVVLVALIIAGSGVAIYQPIEEKQAALAIAEAQLAQVRGQAVEADRMKALVAELQERGSFVLDRRRLRPTQMEIFDELSALLPTIPGCTPCG